MSFLYQLQCSRTQWTRILVFEIFSSTNTCNTVIYVCMRIYTRSSAAPPAPTSPAFPNNTALTVDEHKNQSKFMRCSVPPPPPYFNVEGARHKPAQESLDTTTPPATTVTVNKQPHQHWTLGSGVQQHQVWTLASLHRGTSTLNIGERGPAASAWSQPIVEFLFDFLVHLRSLRLAVSPPLSLCVREFVCVCVCWLVCVCLCVYA